VKKENLLKGLVVAMSLVSPMVFAESAYPPAFEPKVLYQDSDLMKKSTALQAPKVRSAQESAVSSSSISKQSAPAAVASSAPVASSSSTVSSGSDKSDSSNMTVLLAGIAVAGAAFWMMRRPSIASNTGSASNSISGATVAAVAPVNLGLVAVGGAETGVAKYILGLPPVDLPQTGVAKYLRTLPPPVVAEVPETGVAKYLKSLPKPPVLPTDDTGVTKYLKSL
jgi:hypothetical protein